MLNIDDLRGVIPPIVTPVDTDEYVCEQGLKKVIDYVLAGGVHGVFVLGSNGEFYALDYENQRRAVEITVKHVNGKVPVYAVVMKDCLNLIGVRVGHPVRLIDHCTEERLGAIKKVLSDLELIDELTHAMEA